jgi:hypothetical protein
MLSPICRNCSPDFETRSDPARTLDAVAYPQWPQRILPTSLMPSRLL